jgi:hypothetical protein
MLRYALSRRLLDAGTELAMDRQEMWRRSEREGHARLRDGDLQALAVMDAVSAVKIRLGMLLLPSRIPSPDVSSRPR